MVVHAKDEETWVILDGQQRLATIVILGSVLRDLAESRGGTEGKYLAREIQRDVIQFKDEFYLRMNDADNLYFRQAIQEFQPKPPTIGRASHNAIFKAQKRLRDKVGHYVGQDSPQTILARLKELKTTLLEHYLTVILPLSDPDDAYQVFETLNDRGLQLSIPDLVLNFLMARAKAADREAVKERWETVVERMGTREPSVFLRDAWISRHGDVKKQNLFKEIKQEFKRNPIQSLQFVLQLDEDAKLYSSILRLDKSQLGGAVADVGALVYKLAIPSVRPLLLAGRRELNTTEFKRLAGLCVRLVIRYFVVTDHASGDLENILYGAAKLLNAGSTDKAKLLNEIEQLFAKDDVTDPQIIAGCQNLELNKGEAQYIVGCLADFSFKSNDEVGTKEVDLEHIFPQKPNKSAWPNQDELREYLWHLGNLTKLAPPLNKTIGNRSFDEKRKLYTRSKVPLTVQIASYSEWTPETIRHRAVSLATDVARLWPAIRQTESGIKRKRARLK
jgi:hypothetical protein